MVLVFILFIVAPVGELWLLIEVGGLIGAPATVAAVLLTGVVGATLAKREGLRTLSAFSEATARGELPATHIGNGLAIFMGGALLLTPGFLTDALGFALLLPSSRRVLVAWLARGFAASRQTRVVQWPPSGCHTRESDADPMIYNQTFDTNTRQDSGPKANNQ